MELIGLRIFAARHGERVTGRVEFPYSVNGRTSCPIDYHSRRPDSQSPIPNPQSPIDPRAAQRLDLVHRWQKLCKDNPKVSPTKLARRLASGETPDIKVSPSSLRGWARKLETEGVDGLRDRYVKPPKKVSTIDAARATDAVRVCCWWAFRIANVEVINTKLLHSAVALLEAGYAVADIIATIDCYYSYSCDRTQYPFLPLARWAKYHFDKWLFRACDANDYRRALAEGHQERVPLQTTTKTLPASVPDAKTRKRDVLHRGTRRAIRDLATSGEGKDPLCPRSPTTNLQHSAFDIQPSAVAHALRTFGHPAAARREVASAAPGIPALSANQDPQTIAEGLGTLDDGYRVMLIKAAQGDRHARDQAISTLPLWWDAMPQTVRHNITFKVDAWIADHPRVTTRQASTRMLDMLLPAIRNHRSGAQQLIAAARIPR